MVNKKPPILSSITGFFTENLGQKGEGAGHFYCQAEPLSVSFGTGWVVYDYRPSKSELGSCFRVSFEGAHPVIPSGSDPLTHKTNFFLGNDPGRWVRGALNYRRVVYPSLYDGIDLGYTIDCEQLKYEFTVEPGGDPSSIMMAYQGVDGLGIDASTGDLLIRTPSGTLHDEAPLSYQDGQGGRTRVPSSYRLVEDTIVAIDVGSYDSSLPLVIDPGLDFSTYFGGSTDEVEQSILVSVAEDKEGNILVTTTTNSSDFPVTTGAYCTTKNPVGPDLVLFKLSQAGSKLLFSTFIGGSGWEVAVGLDQDRDGNVYLFGRTASSDFPTTSGAYQTLKNGIEDGFVLRLDPTGSDMGFCTYFGGSNSDEFVYDIDLDALGNIYLTGRSDSTDLPVTSGCYDGTNNGVVDVFLAKLDRNATRVLACTYIGGTSNDIGGELMVVDNDVYVAGWTSSDNLPATVGAYTITYQGGARDGFVLRMDTNMSSLGFLTYLGGASEDSVYQHLSLDSSGNLVLGGFTSSRDFPVTNRAYDRTHNGLEDGFITKMDPDGNRLLFSTFLGGSANDRIIATVHGDEGSIFFSGETLSDDLPVTDNAYDWTLSGGRDSFVGRLSSNGSVLEYLTYLGGSKRDQTGFGGISRDFSNTTVVGSTDSQDYPTTPGAYMRNNRGGRDIFVTRLETEVPTGTAPSEPVDLTVRNMTRSVFLKWAEPADNGDLRIKGYNIFRGNTSSQLDLLDTIDSTVKCEYLDMPLENGRTYYYAVSAFNLMGEGPRTSVVSAIPFGIPGAPLNFTGTPGSKTAFLSWKEPDDDGGYPITGYRLFRGENILILEQLLDLDNVTNYLDGNLTNGKTYYYRLQAFTEKGFGNLTNILAVKPAGPPSEPITLTATPGDGFVLLRWRAPLDDGGSQVLGYRVMRGLSEGSLSEIKVVIGDIVVHNDTTVVNGRTYFYSVLAYTEAGNGPRCVCVSVTPLGRPSRPLDLTVVEGNGEATLTWNPPEDDGGAEIQGYRVHRGEDPDGLVLLGQVGGAVLSYQDSGLVNGQKYYYRVVAFNVVGNGTASEPLEATPRTTPDPPRELLAVGEALAVNLTWEGPLDDGGALIEKYVLYRGEDPQDLSVVAEMIGSVLDYRDTSVVPGTRYYYAISAVNAAGEGARTVHAEATPFGTPSPPLNLDAEASDGQVTLSWDPPETDRASPISRYFILRGESNTSLRQTYELGPVLSFIDSNVTNDRTYFYAVRAVNGAGMGEMSGIVDATPRPSAFAPGKVRDLLGRAKGASVILSWTGAESDGGSPVTGFVVLRGRTADGLVAVATLGVVDSWTDEDVVRGTSYYYSVQAVNDMGEGEPVEAILVKVPKERKDDGPGPGAVAALVVLATLASLSRARRRD